MMPIPRLVASSATEFSKPPLCDTNDTHQPPQRQGYPPWSPQAVVQARNAHAVWACQRDIGGARERGELRLRSRPSSLGIRKAFRDDIDAAHAKRRRLRHHIVHGMAGSAIDHRNRVDQGVRQKRLKQRCPSISVAFGLTARSDRKPNR